MKKVARRAPKIVVDPEFKDLVPALTEQERQDLEASIAAEGLRDALVTWRGVLLDGHHRYEICERLDVPWRVVDAHGIEDRADAVIWIVRNALARRNLTAAQKIELALSMEAPLREKARERQVEAGKTAGRAMKRRKLLVNLPKAIHVDDEIAGSAGVSPKQVSKVRSVLASGDEKLKGQMRRGDVSIHAAAKEVRKTEAKKDRAAADSEALRGMPAVTERYKLVCCDVRKVDTKIVADESVDWIITDPPYPKEYLPLWSELSKFAARVLKPGGSVVAMSGQSFLPEVLQRLSEELEYYWTLAYTMPGVNLRIHAKAIGTSWKPLVWMRKTGAARHAPITTDIFTSGAKDKSEHDWGQSESGMADIVRRMTEPAQVICDPFMGAGTTGVVSVTLGRYFIGIDSESGSVAKARRRLKGASV